MEEWGVADSRPSKFEIMGQNSKHHTCVSMSLVISNCWKSARLPRPFTWEGSWVLICKICCRKRINILWPLQTRATPPGKLRNYRLRDQCHEPSDYWLTGWWIASGKGTLQQKLSQKLWPTAFHFRRITQLQKYPHGKITMLEFSVVVNTPNTTVVSRCISKVRTNSFFGVALW